VRHGSIIISAPPLGVDYPDFPFDIRHNRRQCTQPSARLRQFSGCDSAVRRHAGRYLWSVSNATAASGVAVDHVVKPPVSNSGVQRIGDISRANVGSRPTAPASDDIESARFEPG
jgi:hypothetical protein